MPTPAYRLKNRNRSRARFGQKRGGCDAIASPVPQICVIADSFVEGICGRDKISSGQWPLVTTLRNPGGIPPFGEIPGCRCGRRVASLLRGKKPGAQRVPGKLKGGHCCPPFLPAPIIIRGDYLIEPASLVSSVRCFVSVGRGTSMSSLRITMLVAFIDASSKPCPWVMASVGHASTQYPQKMQRL